ncbi:hypothetical protein ACMA1I_08670 [Pontibacter sp. 13R65]|uniref:hypothetical protein n=1 Tax=Pontibacter sp. 13R65 TaxID=3127458 RepID=UPI00301E5D07
MKRIKTFPYLLLQVISLFFLIMLLPTACKETENNKAPSIAGYYKIESLYADRQVDLNNDGNVSTDVMEEVSRNRFNRQYNFDSPSAYMEIRPTKHNHTTHQYLYVPFPDPRLTFEYTDSPNGAVTYLRNELNGIGYKYSYDEKNKLIYIDRTDVEEKNEEFWGQLVDMKVIEKDRLELLVSKNYYDFVTASWIRLQLTAIYVRVED